MKKKIFLFLIFIITFFVGENKIFAADKACSVTDYDNKCTYVNYGTAQTLVMYYKGNETWFVTEVRYKGVLQSRFFYYNTDDAHDSEGRYYHEAKLDGNCKIITNVEIKDYNKVKASEVVNGCPKTIYNRNWYTRSWGVNTSYEEWSTTYYDDPELTNLAIANLVGSESHMVFQLHEDEKNKEPEKPKPQKPMECKDLIDEDLRKYINDIMTYIRIGVPILLIGLIIYDLATGVFASAEDKVKKAKDRAIKRVIVAIAIFFIPTLINFVFDLVNDTWSTKYEICGLEQE